MKLTMRTTVETRRFSGLPLVTGASAEDDYSVSIDSMRAGRIMRQARSFGQTVWLWTVTGLRQVARLGARG